MKLKSWLHILSVIFCVGCGAQTAIDADTQVQRELKRTPVDRAETVDQKQAPLEVKPVQTSVQERYDGVLGDNGACLRLISDEGLFSEADASRAWADYEGGKFEAAAVGFVAAAQGGALSKADKQKALFLAALATQKIKGDAEAAKLMAKAFEISAPLKRSAAIYGTQKGYAAKLWPMVVEFTEALLTHDDYRTYRGIALSNLGQHEAAAAEFEQIKKYPKNLRLDALAAHARAQSETAQLKASLETYRRIYELDPNSAQGQLAQDAIMAEKDRWPAGFVFPRPSKKVDTSKSARDVALDHFNAHRSEKAITAYTKLLKDDKRRKDTPKVCEDLYNIARSHVKLRQHTKSMPFFREALDTCQNDELHIKILYSAGKAAWNAGEKSQAVAWYQDIIDNYASHSYADDAYHYQAQILMEQGKAEEARNALKSQIAAYPDGDMAKDAYWMLLSDMYGNGAYQEAVDFVDASIAHAGESDLYSQGRLRYFQGRAYEKLGNPQAATQNYLMILSEYPLSYYAMLSLGRLEALDEAQATLWIETHRPEAFTPEQGLDYCFQIIEHEQSFQAAKTLAQIGLYKDALDEIDPLLNSAEPRVTYEARLARSILLQKDGRTSESARLAAGLLKPAQDLVYQSYAPWLLAYPKPWSNLVEAAAKPESTLYYTTYAIMREESYYNPKAESWANARGLMQVMLPTAQSTAQSIGMSKPEAKDLFKPEISIPIGSAYIDKLHRILAPHPMLVLPGYNAGQGNVGKWMNRFAELDMDMYVEKIPFKEARHYAKRVGTTLWRYRWLYDKNMPKLFDPAQNLGELGVLKEE